MDFTIIWIIIFLSAGSAFGSLLIETLLEDFQKNVFPKSTTIISDNKTELVIFTDHPLSLLTIKDIRSFIWVLNSMEDWSEINNFEQTTFNPEEVNVFILNFRAENQKFSEPLLDYLKFPVILSENSNETDVVSLDDKKKIMKKSSIAEFEIVDYWNGRRFTKGEFRVSEKIKMRNLQGKNLRGTTFEIPPLVFQTGADGNQLTLRGPEIEMVETLAKSLNFIPDYRSTTQGSMWGLCINGTCDGMRGDVQFARTDFGFGNTFIMSELWGLMDTTNYYNYDGWCFLAKKPDPPANWLGIIKPFDVMVWGGYVFVLGQAILGILFFRLIFPELGIRKSRGVLGIIGFVTGEPLNFSTSLDSIKIFLTPFMLCITVLSFAYSGSLISFLTIKGRAVLLETLEQLNTIDSSTAIGTFKHGINLEAEFRNSINPEYQRLADRFDPYEDMFEAYTRAGEGKLVMGETKNLHEFTIRKRFTSRFGETNLYILKQCWYHHYIAIVLPRHSIYTEPFSDRIVKLVEGGFVRKWINDEMDKAARLAEQTNKATVRLTTLALSDLRVPFLGVVCMAILAILVFFIEIWTVRIISS